MISYRLKTSQHLHSATCGHGKIASPGNVIYLDADGRDLEIILENAPFLKDGRYFPLLQTFTNCEAGAAALAFNFTES